MKSEKDYPMAPVFHWSKEIMECKSPLNFSCVWVCGGGVGMKMYPEGPRKCRAPQVKGECPRHQQVHLESCQSPHNLFIHSFIGGLRLFSISWLL